MYTEEIKLRSRWHGQQSVTVPSRGGINGENFATIPIAKRTACCRNKRTNGKLFGKLRLFNRYVKSTIWPQNFYMPLLFI